MHAEGVAKLTAALLARRWAPGENLEKIPTISTARVEARTFGAEETVRFSRVRGALIDVGVIDLLDWFYHAIFFSFIAFFVSLINLTLK